jgi:pimeloyl-ACP methyl ester carboxylesterase
VQSRPHGIGLSARLVESVFILAVLDWIAQNWAMLAIMGTCLSLLVAALWLLGHYVRICLNIFVDTTPPLSMNPVDFQPMEGEIVRFRSYDGLSLRGMHLEPPQPGPYKGTIVFCHEYGSDMYSCARYTRPLLEAGFNVFTFDYRAHGESSGADYNPLQWPSDKELGDTLGACAHVESVLRGEGRKPDIGLFGISRGAGAGLLASAANPNIKAIVCDGAFSTETTLVALMKRWAHIFATVKLVYENHPDAFWTFLCWTLMRFAQPKLRRRFPSVRKALKDMQPRPIFFIHGQRDSYIRVDQTQLLHDAAPTPKYLWIVKDAKHNQAVVTAPEAYAARTVAFFEKHLAGEDISELRITSDPAAEEVA